MKASAVAASPVAVIGAGPIGIAAAAHFVHSCGTVRPHGHRELAHPEPGFYVIGAKRYGRAPNFLLATGYEQARSVAAAVAGDLAAADDLRLELPENGVCSVDLASADLTGGSVSSCGSTTNVEATACGVRGEPDQSPGQARCGSSPAAALACCG